MGSPNLALQIDLLAMAAEDGRIRAELAADGSLFEGYHPRMADVHRRNAGRLAEIIDEYGWPGSSLVGEEGSSAAWLILQHAIGSPGLQRRGVCLLEEAVARGDAPAIQVAYLTDRIRFFEGRPQIYGTQFDWDEAGELRPYPVEDPSVVDALRIQVGLPPLEEQIATMRREMSDAGPGRPDDFKARRKAAEEWARAVGWRD